MKRTMRILSAFLTVSLIAPAAFAAHTHLPANSTWRLNVAQSDFGGGPVMKADRFTIITDTDKWLKFTEVETDNDGKVWRTSWSGPQNGTLRPVVGMPGAKASFNTDDDTSRWEMPDGSVADIHFESSGDGKTETEHAVLKMKDGTEYHQTWVYDRVR